MTQPTTAYPLTWPPNWKRTPAGRRTTAKFGKQKTVKAAYGDHFYKTRADLTIEQATTRVLEELGRMGIQERTVIISSDLRLRNDGLPYSSQATAKLDPGVAVYWTDSGSKRCMAIDRYSRIVDNMAALAATIEAMRAIERHGGAEILDRAFTGFTALPAPPVQDLPHEILGVAEHATQAEVDYAYKRLAQQAHPDREGGSNDFMAQINAARDAMTARIREGAR